MTLQTDERVREIAADIFELPLDRVTMQSTTETVPNWDSIKHLDLVLAIEHEFSVQFEPEDVENIKSIEQITALLNHKLQQSR
jgi:acyl carrier protein